MILKAIKFATKKHKGQKRKVSGEDYITHPILVSYLLPKYKKSKKMEELIVACILHDVIEDTKTSYNEILKNFGPLVTNLVMELTSDKEEIKKIGKNEYLKKKLIGISSYALTIKLVDRLANISDYPTEKYKQDTKELLDFLVKNRKINQTQQKIVIDILNKIDNN